MKYIIYEQTLYCISVDLLKEIQQEYNDKVAEYKGNPESSGAMTEFAFYMESKVPEMQELGFIDFDFRL